MKKIILFTFLSCFCWLSALDNICLKNGEEISCKVIEIAPDFIKYKKASNLNGPLYNLAIHHVLFIKYENGEKELYNLAKSDIETKKHPSFGKFTFLLGGGVAKLKSDDWDSDLIPSFVIGGSYSKKINNHFAYDIGINITRKGGEVRESLYSADFELISLEIPLLIKAKLNPNSHLYSLFGLRTSINLKGEYEYCTYFGYEKDGELELFSAGVIGAIGYETSKFSFEIRADYGLTDISEEDFLDEINDRTFWLIMGIKF